MNLRLHARWQDVLARDPDYAAAERRVPGGAARAAGAVPDPARRRAAGAARGDAARRRRRRAPRGAADAEAVVRLVDERHLARVREARASFEDGLRGRRERAVGRRAPGRRGADPGGRGVGAGRRGRPRRRAAARAAAVRGARSGRRHRLVRGGDGADRARAAVPRPHPATARRDAEFLDSGVGWLRGCVLLPHARRRLRTDDPARMAELAVRARHRRAAWSSTTACGSTSDPHGELPPDARVVDRRRAHRAVA